MSPQHITLVMRRPKKEPPRKIPETTRVWQSMKTRTKTMAWMLAALAGVTTLGSFAAELPPANPWRLIEAYDFKTIRSLEPFVSTKSRKPLAIFVPAEWRMMNGDTIKLAGGEDAVESIPQTIASGRFDEPATVGHYRIQKPDVSERLYAGEGGRIELVGGKVIAYLDPLESVRQIICSKNKKALLLHVFKRLPSEKSSPEWFGRFANDHDPHEFVYSYSSLVLVLPKQLDGNIAWTARRMLYDEFVSDIVTIDDEGRLALVRVVRPVQKEGAMRAEFVWQTWDLDAEKMISEGVQPPK